MPFVYSVLSLTFVFHCRFLSFCLFVYARAASLNRAHALRLVRLLP